MKVCHMTSAHQPNDVRIFLKECRSLKRASHEVVFIVPGTNLKEAEEIIIRGIQSRKSRLGRFVCTVFDIYRCARREKAQIYHFHDPDLIFVAILLKILGSSVIYDVHEDVPRQMLSKYWIPKILRIPLATGFEIVENACSKYFDGIITATPFIQKRFARINKRVCNINNYPLLEEKNTNMNTWAQKEVAACYVGGISEIRGMKEMIQALNIAEIELHLVGAFASESEQRYARANSGWKYVVEHGVLARKKALQIMHRSIMGLVLFHPVPNHVNAQPNKLFEYMAAGIPVIASDFPLWKEIILKHGCGICVNPLDPNEIAQAINYIVNNIDEAKVMGKNGLRAMEENFSWAHEEIKLINFYDEVLRT